MKALPLNQNGLCLSEFHLRGLDHVFRIQDLVELGLGEVALVEDELIYTATGDESFQPLILLMCLVQASA